MDGGCRRKAGESKSGGRDGSRESGVTPAHRRSDDFHPGGVQWLAVLPLQRTAALLQGLAALLQGSSLHCRRCCAANRPPPFSWVTRPMYGGQVVMPGYLGFHWTTRVRKSIPLSEPRKTRWGTSNDVILHQLMTILFGAVLKTLVIQCLAIVGDYYAKLANPNPAQIRAKIEVSWEKEMVETVLRVRYSTAPARRALIQPLKTESLVC